MPENNVSTRCTESPDDELARLRVQNAEQAALIEQLRQRIEELEARLAKDSHNSSKPPSSDPPFNNPPPCSQRKPSGRKRGGQKGHRGETRPLVEDPEHRVIIPLTGTCACGRCRAEIATEVLPERRQVVELVIHREVTEYRNVGGACACGREQRSAFPEGIAAPVQYGPGMSAFAVYMTQYQLVVGSIPTELTNTFKNLRNTSPASLPSGGVVGGVPLRRLARSLPVSTGVSAQGYELAPCGHQSQAPKPPPRGVAKSSGWNAT
jgi:transposase